MSRFCFENGCVCPLFVHKLIMTVISVYTSWTTSWTVCPSFCPGRFRTLPDGRLFVRQNVFALVFSVFMFVRLIVPDGSGHFRTVPKSQAIKSKKTGQKSTQATHTHV